MTDYREAITQIGYPRTPPAVGEITSQPEFEWKRDVWPKSLLESRNKVMSLFKSTSQTSSNHKECERKEENSREGIKSRVGILDSVTASQPHHFFHQLLFVDVEDDEVSLVWSMLHVCLFVRTSETFFLRRMSSRSGEERSGRNGTKMGPFVPRFVGDDRVGCGAWRGVDVVCVEDE